MPYTLSYLLFLSLMTLVTFFLFHVDKKRSKVEGANRIPEAILLFFSSFGGSAGALLGMRFLHHKCNWKLKFHFFITAWLSFIIEILGLFAILFMEIYR